MKLVWDLGESFIRFLIESETAGWLGWGGTAHCSGILTVAELLSDLPAFADLVITQDRDPHPAFMAARRLFERDLEGERLGLPRDEDTYDHDPDLEAATLLLTGRYELSPVLGQVRAEVAERRGPGAPDVLIGSLEPWGITVQGVEDCYAGSDIHVVARAQVDQDWETRKWDRYCLADLVLDNSAAARPLPRWVGLSKGSCLLRSRAVAELVSAVQWQQFFSHEDAAFLSQALVTIHAPKSQEDVEWGTDASRQSDVRELIRSCLDDVDLGRGNSMLPDPRLLKGFAAAEAYVAEILVGLGYTDAAITPSGSDGGVDVTSGRAVAQVKMEALPTGRPALQALFGVASLEGKVPLFFSLAGYSAQALDWAARADMACFEFATDGSVEARTPAAVSLLRHGAS